ncbi:DUF892 family protein [Sphingomonas sp.]|uniref:DUF892 family protein n=1 Tax=Sphingomonas sp. TaxID=28214 RepID=UPI002EDA59FA
MADTETAQNLLTTCIQDLLAGEQDLAARLPAVAAQAKDEALRTTLGEIAAQAQAHAQSLEDSGRAKGGPDNLWMRGILDDAERDTRTIAAGPLLDTAMIGAVRKALAAKRASYETAIAMAEALAERELATTVRRLHADEAESDARLSALLAETAAAAVGAWAGQP